MATTRLQHELEKGGVYVLDEPTTGLHGRAPQPRVPARLRRVAVRLPDDAAHRARDGAAASWRPQRHRGLFRGRLRVAGHLQHSLHRPGRYAAQHLPAPRGARDGGAAVVRGETGDQTDQESRSAGHRAAPSMTVMDITIHGTFLPHDDPDASLAFYRDTLGLEVRNDSASSWPPPTSTAPSRGCRPAAPKSSRSRPSSRTGFATAPSAIPRGT